MTERGSVVIDPMQASDIASVLNLADRVFGPSYCRSSRFSKRKNNHVALCAKDKGICIGFLLGWPETIGRLEKKLRIAIDLGEMDRGAGIWYLKLICVRPEYRRRGVAKRMIHTLISKAQSALILTTAWQKAGERAFPAFHRKVGFLPISSFPDYWYHDSLKRAYQCPVCGPGCHCTMWLGSLSPRDV